jgi:hypothetical protein
LRPPREAGAEFVVVGVGGIDFYARTPAEAFATLDVDAFVAPAVDNLRRALRALSGLGDSFEAGGEPFVDLADSLVLGRIIEIEIAWIGAAKGLVWPLVIVNPDEPIEALLLLQEVERRRLGGFLLEREMHALMAPVLLRATRLDALDLDPQPEPPDGQLRETDQRVG